MSRSVLRAARAAAPAVATSIAAAVLAVGAATAAAQDVLVVAPKDLQPALAGWVKHRSAQGLAAVVREPAPDVATVVKAAHAASGGKLRFVLIVGDVDRVPCAYVPVVATAKWERDTRIATDAPYADVSGDGVPDLAIGRIPADSAEEARAILARSIAYETSRDFGEWRRRANVVAGTGGFGALQDAALENMTKQFLTRNVPPSVVVSGTYGNPLSAWCPPPAEFADTVVERFNEGSLLLAYIGHGSPHELDHVKLGRERFPIFGAGEVGRVDVRHGAPLVVFIACSTGKYDGDRDCLAEDLLRRPNGPVGVIASSRVSTPYSNGILSKEMLAVVWQDRVATAGELLLAMKRRLVEPREGDTERKDIEGLAAVFFEKDPALRDADRREHLALYNLLGDPCVRLARPTELALDAPATVVAGTNVDVAGTAPAAGRLVVEIVRRRDAAVPLGPRKTPDDYRATYRAANSLEVARTEIDVPAGPFRATLSVASGTRPGACYVRAYLAGDTVGAAGGRLIDVSAAKSAEPGGTPAAPSAEPGGTPAAPSDGR